MTLDLTKIRPGDKVTVELVVHDAVHTALTSDHIAVKAAKADRFYLPIPVSIVIAHAPVRREIAVGDAVVQCIDDRPVTGATRVLAINGTKAWIDGWTFDRVVPLSELRHV